MDAVSDTGTLYPSREDGKEVRRYDSALRRAGAQQTRQAVLDAGRALITERGYVRTTMREVAAGAGIAIETVYLHFRNKPTLLKALLDTAVGGDEQPIAVAQRDWVQQVIAEPTAPGKLVMFAENVTAVHARLAPLFLAVRAAADADPAAAELWTARKAERLQGMSAFAHQLIDTGVLRPDLAVEEIRDTLFTLASPEVYGLLVLELHWAPGRFICWLTDTLTERLLARNTP